jgi:hypothetical protein
VQWSTVRFKGLTACRRLTTYRSNPAKTLPNGMLAASLYGALGDQKISLVNAQVTVMHCSVLPSQAGVRADGPANSCIMGCYTGRQDVKLTALKTYNPLTCSRVCPRTQTCGLTPQGQPQPQRYGTSQSLPPLQCGPCRRDCRWRQLFSKQSSAALTIVYMKAGLCHKDGAEGG